MPAMRPMTTQRGPIELGIDVMKWAPNDGKLGKGWPAWRVVGCMPGLASTGGDQVASDLVRDRNEDRIAVLVDTLRIESLYANPLDDVEFLPASPEINPGGLPGRGQYLGG